MHPRLIGRPNGVVGEGAVHFTVNVKEGCGEAGGAAEVTGTGGVDVDVSCDAARWVGLSTRQKWRPAGGWGSLQCRLEVELALSVRFRLRRASAPPRELPGRWPEEGEGRLPGGWAAR